MRAKCALWGNCHLPWPAPVLAGCQAETDTPARSVLRIAASRLTEALAREYAKALPNVRVETVGAAAPPVSVADAIERGEADMGVAFADSVYSAYASQTTEAHRSSGRKELRAISALYVAPLILMARAGRGHPPHHGSAGAQCAHQRPDSRRFAFPHGVEGAARPGRWQRPAVRRDRALTTRAPRLRRGPPPPFTTARARRPRRVHELTTGTLDAIFTTDYDSGQFVSLLLEDRCAHDSARRSGHRAPATRVHSFIRPLSIPPVTYEGQAGVLHTVGVDSS